MKRIYKLLFGIILTLCMTTYVYAASASISVSSSTSKVVVGNTFTVTIKVSSGTALGSWDFTPSYDTKIFKMVSGKTAVADVVNNKTTKSKSYKYKFKAIGTGTGKITVKSYGVVSYDEAKMSVSAGSKTIKVITQKELEASYSKDNYLKKLSIDGLTLSPSFNKDKLEYTAEAGANTTSINIKATKNDSRSSVSGAGKKEVAEGENVFKITVKAQNGSTRVYKVTVNVIDPNPITVKVNDKEYTIVKRQSVLTCPNGFDETTIKINDIDVPAFHNELNNYTLVGLKNTEETSLFIYNQESNTYQKYYNIELDSLNIYPLEIDKDFGDKYKQELLSINDISFNSLNLKDTDYYIIKARNLETGKDDYYLYDKSVNNAIRYKEAEKEKEIVNIYTKDSKSDKYKTIILILSSLTTTSFFVALFSSISKSKAKKKLNFLIKKINEEKQKEKEEEKQKEEVVEERPIKRRGRPKKIQEE